MCIRDSTTVCDGEILELAIQSYSGTNVTYNWTYNTAAIANNSNTLIIDPATSANSGTYAVSVEVDGCPSDIASVVVDINTAITLDVDNQTLACVDGSGDLTLTSAVSGGISPYTYSWTGPNGFTSSDAMPVISNITATNSGTYNLVITDSLGCVSAVSYTHLTLPTICSV